MKRQNQNENPLAGGVLWWVTVFVAALILALSLYDATTFTLAKAGIVIVSIFVASLICRYEFEIPGTSSQFLPTTLFAFWGIIWTGVSGGVLLGTAAAIAASGLSPANRHRSIRRTATHIFATFAAGVAYYAVSGYLQSAGNSIFPLDVIYASAAMAVVYYICTTIVAFSFFQIGADGAGETSATILKAPIASNVLTLVATVVFYLVFEHFGIEFGLIFVPLALLGNIAFKIHLRGIDQKTREITEASRLHLATVEALATAIDARDQVGSGHVRRTQLYAVGLGFALGLDTGEIDALRMGALLHDIGKLAVPDHILNKPGKLTDAEMEKAKIHSSVGSAILEEIGFPNPVVPTVRYHHEFWDGSGYPDKLAGNEIPLTARILAIADAFDTLRGDRPYRAAVSREEACNFLRARAGTQYDPRLVDIFLKNLKSFEREISLRGLSYETEPRRTSISARTHDVVGPITYVEQIQSANREVFTLYSLAREFGSALDIEETLSLFTQKIEEFVPFDTCVVYLMDPGNEFAAAAHSVGLYGDLLKSKSVALGEGATGYALKQRKAVNNVDPALDFAFAHSEIGHQYIAMASLPLIADDRLIGAISLYSTSMSNYEDEHMRLIETVSRIAADAISKSLQHAQAEIYALTDPMTGLPNARSLQIQFDKEVKRASRNGNSFQLLMLDLDGFKAVNDTYGHKVGDALLKEVAGVIRFELRDYDFLARYAGDEFVAIVPETDSHGVLELCRRIEAAVKAFELNVGDARARVGVSVGSACYPNHGESFDQVLIAADKAMYLTKAVHKQRKELIKWGETPPARPAGASHRRRHTNESVKAEVSESCVEVVSADHEDSLIVEVDESHIVSRAVN